MTIPLDSQAKDFQEQLRRRAAKKKAVSMGSWKQRFAVSKEKEKAQPQDVLTSIYEQLNEIRTLLTGVKPGASGPVTFEVTERSSDGKIKAFKVEQA